MKGISDVLAADITGEWELGKYAGPCERPPTHDEIAQLASVCTWPARRPPNSTFGCVLNKNSYGPTRECEVPGKLTH